ncbi:hypothetical protein SAMN05421736_11529 [Evansella caseinilytica]|uniref:Uncharacterized protein n=1 Tax=Evansella caseinilytica TaxID=1503961 RepID=A0A1H3TK42_9BACI|nr:hypothetical protein [Evansella caseinilytica]SDZ50576.1 hypothetical protein SAMN05421736_11529 [Evansella caseinilytica]
MSIKFNQYDNELVVENNKIVFEHDIRYVVEVNDTLIVLLEIPNNTSYLNNVFGINKNGEIKWRIQNVADVFPVKNQLPFENLMVNGTGVFVSDFYGRRFSLNPTNGEIFASDVVR